MQQKSVYERSTTAAASLNKRQSISNDNGLVLLENYPLFSIPTTPRRYERDRQTASMNKIPPESASTIDLPSNASQSSGTTPRRSSNRKQYSNHHNHQSIAKRDWTKTHFAKMVFEYDKSLKLLSTMTTALNQPNSTTRELFLSEKSKKSTYSQKNANRFCNVKQVLISIVTFISFANIVYDGRILCDHKIYPRQTSRNEAQAVSSLLQHKTFNPVQSNHIPSYHQNALKRSLNAYSSTALPLSLTNQLMLLLSPLIHDEQLDHKSQLHDSKSIATNQQLSSINVRSSDYSSNNNNQSDQYHQSLDSVITVTSTPVTATLMAPSLFQSVTPPTFFEHHIESSKLVQDNNDFKTNFLSPITQNVNPPSINQLKQSDISPIMSDSKPPLVFKDIVDTNIGASYVKHNPVTPLIHILPLADVDYTMALSSTPMVVARNSIKIAGASSGPTNFPSTEKSKQSKTYSRRLRSLLDKNQVNDSPTNTNIAKPRSIIWEMATDPSLMVTLFHMVDRASFALPLGFFLMPFIQMIKSPPGSGFGLARFLPARATHRSIDYEELAKRIDYVDRLLSKALRPSHRSGEIGK